MVDEEQQKLLTEMGEIKKRIGAFEEKRSRIQVKIVAFGSTMHIESSSQSTSWRGLPKLDSKHRVQ